MPATPRALVTLGRFAVSAVLVAAPASAQSPATARVSSRIEITAGSTAEYRVREQLARLNFPNDAIGTSATLSGHLLLAAGGAIAGGKLTVDLRDLRSDSDRRDSFIRENTLHTNRFPLAEFVPRRQQGLPAPLPSSGKATFKLIGDMTIHGTTSELTWDVTAQFAPGAVTGEAATRFPFAKFGIAIPKVMGLLSVDDDIRLVLNFKGRPARAAP